MRFQLLFELKKAELPIDYRRCFLSFYKKALQNCRDGKYLETYYHDTVQKDFSWALQLRKPKFFKNKIELESKEVKVIFSAENSKNTGYIFFLVLSAMKYNAFPLANQNAMTLKDIRQIREEKIVEETCVFKTMLGAPLVVREHDKATNTDRYFCVEHENYNDLLTESIKRQLLHNTNFAEEVIETISCEMIQGKKVVVKNYGQLIDTTAGTFVVKGTSSILTYLLEAGMSGKRSQGFGAVQLLAQLNIRKEE